MRLATLQTLQAAPEVVRFSFGFDVRRFLASALLAARLPARRESTRSLPGAKRITHTFSRNEKSPVFYWGRVARPERLELPTLWFEARCSIQLSYGRTVVSN
jgi:hypothetical protein